MKIRYADLAWKFWKWLYKNCKVEHFHIRARWISPRTSRLVVQFTRYYLYKIFMFVMLFAFRFSFAISLSWRVLTLSFMVISLSKKFLTYSSFFRDVSFWECKALLVFFIRWIVFQWNSTGLLYQCIDKIQSFFVMTGILSR